MQGEGGGRLATWIAGVLGVWAGLAALGSLTAAVMFPQWALVREPIVLSESPSRPTDYAEEAIVKKNNRMQAFQPMITTITFKVGLLTVCPHINASNLHTTVSSPPCSTVRYSKEHITYEDLHLPASAPLVQTVVARMRLSTPFIMLSCCLLTIGTFLAIIGRCCYAHASLVAALMYSLGGLSVGVGVVWFVSVISEEYGMASGRRTSWSDLYAYRYGWSVMAAGVGGVSALLAALLTGHSHLARHAPWVTILKARSGSTDESLARPLLRCRSEGCLGQRSFTSDTIRTYLTCDSRRHPPRGCSSGPLPYSSSIVDLTKPTEDFTHLPDDPSQTQEDSPSDATISRRSSKVTIVGEDVKDFPLPEQPQQQQRRHQQQQQLSEQQKQPLQGSPQHKMQQPTQNKNWSAETSRVVIESPRGSVFKVAPHPPVSQVLSPITTVPPPPPLSSSSSTPSPLDVLPPPLPAKTEAGTSRRSSEQLRQSGYNTFVVGDYSRTLPTEGRQMAVFNGRSVLRSSTLRRSSSKISSEV